MKHLFAAALLFALAAPAAAQAPALNAEQATLLQCSAIFGIVASEQARGIDSGYPPLGERGREYFVRALAQLMDQLGLTREQVSAMLQAEVERLQSLIFEAEDSAAAVDGIMQTCLVSLAASGL